MRLFRQKAMGDWAGVMERVVEELQEMAMSRNGARVLMAA
jgi:hypothetical protein